MQLDIRMFILLGVKQEKYDAAIEDCTRAIELNPVYVKAVMRRAELYEKTDKLDEALTDHAKVLELDPAQHASREACMVGGYRIMQCC